MKLKLVTLLGFKNVWSITTCLSDQATDPESTNPIDKKLRKCEMWSAKSSP